MLLFVWPIFTRCMSSTCGCLGEDVVVLCRQCLCIYSVCVCVFVYTRVRGRGLPCGVLPRGKELALWGGQKGGLRITANQFCSAEAIIHRHHGNNNTAATQSPAAAGDGWTTRTLLHSSISCLRHRSLSGSISLFAYLLYCFCPSA